jgi:hypothetical protein
MPFRNHWFFNTDESEDEGKGAHERMIKRSCIAAWGDCRGKGADTLLQVPRAGDLVFLYRVGYGMVACGTFTDERPFENNEIFAQWGEYHRRLVNFKALPPTKVLSPRTILERTGYYVPARQILCKIHHATGADFIENYFNKEGIDVAQYFGKACMQ